jgi:hypothetical protein
LKPLLQVTVVVQPSEIVSYDEAARMLGVTKDLLQRHGEIPRYQPSNNRVYFRRITGCIKNAYSMLVDKAACILSNCCFLHRSKAVFFKAGLGHFSSHLKELSANVRTAAVYAGQYVSARTESETKNAITPPLDNLLKIKIIGAGRRGYTQRVRVRTFKRTELLGDL